MASENFIVTSLPEYVEQNRDLIIKDVVLMSKTIARIAKQTGIKTKAKLHYLDVEPEFQDGSGCGFNAQGTVKLTDREISTGLIKINMTVCPDTLLGKWAEYLVKIGASEEELPFEKFIVDGIVKAIQDKLEKAVWQGDTTSTDTDLKHFDGFLKIANDEADIIKLDIAADSSAYEAIKEVILSLPEEIINDADIYVSPALFRKYNLEAVEKNLYHYDANHGAVPGELEFPGTDNKIISTPGLAGTNKILASPSRNMYYGTDLESNAEDVKIWFSDDDDIFKIKVKWNSGVQFAFTDRAVLATIGQATGANVQATGAETTVETVEKED